MAVGGNTGAPTNNADIFFAANARFVGGLQFWSVSGTPPYPGMSVEPLGRSNVDGIAARQRGRFAQRFPVIARTDIAASIGIHLAQQEQMALKGLVISWRNDRIMDYNKYLCWDVEFPQVVRGAPNPQRVTSSIGGLLPDGTAAFWMTTIFTLQYTLGV